MTAVISALLIMFDTNRWLIAASLQEAPEGFVHSKTLVPFGLGPRSCPGQHLAITELKVLTAKVFVLSDFYPVQKSIIDSGAVVMPGRT